MNLLPFVFCHNRYRVHKTFNGYNSTMLGFVSDSTDNIPRAEDCAWHMWYHCRAGSTVGSCRYCGDTEQDWKISWANNNNKWKLSLKQKEQDCGGYGWWSVWALHPISGLHASSHRWDAEWDCSSVCGDRTFQGWVRYWNCSACSLPFPISYILTELWHMKLECCVRD